MPTVVTLRGGAPVPSKVLVNVDNVTVVGDGSRENPLQAPGGAGSPTVEHLSVDALGGALNPDADTSFAQFSQNFAVPTPLLLTLPDGSVDGHQISVVVDAKLNAIWRIVPASFTDSYVAFPTSQGGAATFVWNATLAIWGLVSTDNGTLV